MSKKRFKFQIDDVLTNVDNTYQIELMTIRVSGTQHEYLGRSRNKNGKYIYAYAVYDDAKGEFTASNGENTWFANGFSYSSFNYVAVWKSKVPEFVRDAVLSMVVDSE